VGSGGLTIKLLKGSSTGTDTFGDRRALIDVVVLVAACIALVLLAVKLGLVDHLAARASDSTSSLLDAAVALLVAVPIAATVFARRRYREVLAMRRELVHLSLHDALTGLPNRRLLADWLAADIQRSQEHNAQAAVLFVDLDRFKYVNDTHGHEVGDRLMRAVADRLRTMLGDRDRLIRFGGDEFVLLCPGLNGAAAAEKVAHRAIAIIEQPFTLGEESMRISASIGVALAEHRGIKPEDVLRDADVAMYQAKAQGQGQVVTFDRSMTGTLTPATAEEQIRAALEAGEFRLHYQPVVDLSTGQIVGAEALLRWVSQSRGTMSPGEFIPILEETGLIVPVGTWVLQEACREVTRLRKALPDHPPITLTVNVSARQIAQVGFGEVVAGALQAAGVGHGQIHLEITEGALMHDVSSAWAVLRQAKALGVKLALDDFGTGYSSLSYVRRFSLDMLKIDKSFIDGVDSSPEDRAIVEHVVGMAAALGMTTVAEGVERPEQLAWLRRLGCRLAQGYVLSRPVSADDLEALLRKRRHQPFEIDASATRPAETAVAAARRKDPWEMPAAAELAPAAPALPPAARRGEPVLFEPAPPLERAADDASAAQLDDRFGEADREAPPTPGGLPAPTPLAGRASRRDRGGSSPALPRLREYRPPSRSGEQPA
jgi:diguanylate cyclase (GGDEF)-like protein